MDSWLQKGVCTGKHEYPGMLSDSALETWRYRAMATPTSHWINNSNFSFLEWHLVFCL